jgi:hypothetical protein
MNSVRSLFLRAGHSLGRHLDRLRCTFDELRDRVRDAAVQAIGQCVAGAVRDSLRAFLEGAATRPPEIPASWPPSLPSWQQNDALFNDPLDADDPRYEPQQRGWHAHDELDDQPSPPQPQTEPAEELRPSRWRQALAIGCSAAAWQLRRHFSHDNGMTTFGIGVLSAVGAYVIGPALIVSALSLVTFTETIRAAGAMSLFGRS